METLYRIVFDLLPILLCVASGIFFLLLLLIGKEIEARLGGLLFNSLRSHSRAPTALSLNS